jgi:hypothetical protein
MEGCPDGRFVRLVRVACVISAVSALLDLATEVLIVVGTPEACPKPEVQFGRVSILIPYLFICTFARSGWMAQVLRMAVVVGFVAGFLTLAHLVFAVTEEPLALFLQDAAARIVFVVMQLVLVFAGFLALRTAPPEPDLRLLGGLLVVSVPIYLWFIFWSTFPEDLLGAERREANAIGTLRQINSAQATFRSTYRSGFSDGLNRLGPPKKGTAASRDGADLLDDIRAGLVTGYIMRRVGGHGTNTGFVKDGYIFKYRPGASGLGCEIDTYTIVGRPERYPSGGCLSLVTDQSGLMRGTREDREATLHDRVIRSRR